MKIATPAGAVNVSDTVLLVGAGLVVLLIGGGLWYVKRKASAAVSAVGDAAVSAGQYLKNEAVNVTSNKNIASLGLNQVLQSVGILETNNLTGKPNTLGSQAYEAQMALKNWLGIK